MTSTVSLTTEPSCDLSCLVGHSYGTYRQPRLTSVTLLASLQSIGASDTLKPLWRTHICSRKISHRTRCTTATWRVRTLRTMWTASRPHRSLPFLHQVPSRIAAYRSHILTVVQMTGVISSVHPTRPKRNRGHHSSHLVLPPALNASVNAACLSTPLSLTGNISAANAGLDTVLGRARAEKAAYEPPDDLTQAEKCRRLIERWARSTPSIREKRCAGLHINRPPVICAQWRIDITYARNTGSRGTRSGWRVWRIMTPRSRSADSGSASSRLTMPQ